jgi:hypothetical protein
MIVGDRCDPRTSASTTTRTSRDPAGSTASRVANVIGCAGCSRFAPPPICPELVHSQEQKLPSADQCHPTGLVPPSRFRTTSTVCSEDRVASLLHLATDRGSPSLAPSPWRARDRAPAKARPPQKRTLAVLVCTLRLGLSPEVHLVPRRRGSRCKSPRKTTFVLSQSTCSVPPGVHRTRADPTRTWVRGHRDKPLPHLRPELALRSPAVSPPARFHGVLGNLGGCFPRHRWGLLT